MASLNFEIRRPFLSPEGLPNVPLIDSAVGYLVSGKNNGNQIPERSRWVLIQYYHTTQHIIAYIGTLLSPLDG